MRVIGIDPGLRHTGWGVVEFKNNKIFHIADGSISPSSKLDDGKRLLEIKNQLQKIINQFHPNISVIEKTFVGSGSVSGSNQSTASFGVYLNISASVAAAGFGSGGGVADIVEDTTPQLGGDLDLNSNDIVGNMIVRANTAADLLSVFDSSNNIVFKVNNNKTLKLSAVTGSQPTSEPGGVMYSGSQWFLGTE